MNKIRLLPIEYSLYIYFVGDVFIIWNLDISLMCFVCASLLTLIGYRNCDNKRLKMMNFVFLLVTITNFIRGVFMK